MKREVGICSSASPLLANCSLRKRITNWREVGRTKLAKSQAWTKNGWERYVVAATTIAALYRYRLKVADLPTLSNICLQI